MLGLSLSLCASTFNALTGFSWMLLQSILTYYMLVVILHSLYGIVCCLPQSNLQLCTNHLCQFGLLPSHTKLFHNIWGSHKLFASLFCNISHTQTLQLLWVMLLDHSLPNSLARASMVTPLICSLTLSQIMPFCI